LQLQLLIGELEVHASSIPEFNDCKPPAPRGRALLGKLMVISRCPSGGKAAAENVLLRLFFGKTHGLRNGRILLPASAIFTPPRTPWQTITKSQFFNHLQMNNESRFMLK
jgi:hypothetical protein